jgi:hypothetical protein
MIPENPIGVEIIRFAGVGFFKHLRDVTLLRSFRTYFQSRTDVWLPKTVGIPNHREA